MAAKQIEETVQEKPWVGKVLLGLYSAVLALLVLVSGWQWQIYQEHKEDIRKSLIKQDAAIEALTKRQDILRQRQETLQAENYAQDQRISKDYVTLERYSCDLRDFKDAVKEGFNSVNRRLDNLSKR